MFSMLEGPDIIVVLVVVLVLFGGSQLPKLARNLGQAQKEFQKGLADANKDKDKPSPSADKPTAAAIAPEESQTP